MAEEPKAELGPQLSGELAQDIARICARTAEMDFVDLVTAYRALESIHLPKVTTDPFLTLETKRRVAERILHAAIDKSRSFEECQQSLSNLLELGFTNLEVKGRVVVILSRYYFQIRRKQEAIELLEPLQGELEEELGCTGLEVYRDLLEITEVVLTQLRASGT